MRYFAQGFLYIFLLWILLSCQEKSWKVDTSQSTYEINLKRFDLEFFEKADDGLDSADWAILQENYPQFLPLYMEGVLRMTMDASEDFYELNQLLQNSDVKTLFSDVEKAYPRADLEAEILELQEAFRFFSHYFPDKKLPEVYSLVSLFSYNIVVDEAMLGLCLDLYLGAEYKFYPSTQIPRYRFKNFERKYLVADALKAYLIAEFDQGGGNNLLEQMIFYGKIAYLQAAFLPELEEELYFNYNEEELAWCEENEAEIWFHFVDMDLLYTNETAQIRKYMDDAPFIPGFPEGSSARVGKWIGYQIVKEYMESQDQLGLAELMAEEDANKILLKSKYKPKR